MDVANNTVDTVWTTEFAKPALAAAAVAVGLPIAISKMRAYIQQRAAAMEQAKVNALMRSYMSNFSKTRQKEVDDRIDECAFRTYPKAERPYARESQDPREDGVDEQDGAILLSLLHKIGVVSRHELIIQTPLFEERGFSAWAYVGGEIVFRCDGAPRKEPTRGAISRKRITYVKLGKRTTLWDLSLTNKAFAFLSRLEKLEILKVQAPLPGRLPDILSRLPHLKHLQLFVNTNDILHLDPSIPDLSHSPLKLLSTYQFPPIHHQGGPACWNLERLTLRRNTMTDDDLIDILFRVLPSLPNLTRLNLCIDGIPSFQKIGHFIRKHQREQLTAIPVASRLRVLSFGPYYNNFQISNILDRDRMRGEIEEEREGVKVLLFAFPQLGSIGGRCFDYVRLHPNDSYRNLFDAGVQYAMDINHAGRVLVEGGVDGGKSESPSTKLPVSVWPRVLERASRWGHDAVYYLLRNVPALQV
jgi:hypothetical protein